MPVKPEGETVPFEPRGADRRFDEIGEARTLGSAKMAMTPVMTGVGFRASRVAIVEDEALIAIWLKRTVEELGHCVARVCRSIEEAWLCRGEDLDLVLLDIDLHGQTTYELARQLRRDGILVIFASGRAKRDIPSDLRDIDFLEKPVDERRLSDILPRQALTAV